MKYRYTLLGLTLLLAGCDQQLTTAQIYDRVKDGTVLIENKIDETNGGLGTGFIIGDNIIITNNHVIDGGGTITVSSPESSKKFAAAVLYKDTIADLAVVQLKDWKDYVTEESPNILKMGDSNLTREGSKIIVVGHPWGLKWSLSEGVMSGKNRRMGPNPKYIDQVDAHLFQGNSGGPIFNEKGEVICVSELMYVRDGGSYGFCIPSNLVKKVLNDFTKYKEVRWNVLNVGIDLTEDNSSVILSTVEPGGAGDKAGLKVNDKILEIFTDARPFGKMIESQDDLVTELASINGGDDMVKIIVDRNGQRIPVMVKTNYKLSSDYEQVK